MRIVADPAGWAGELPAVLVADAEGPAARHALLAAFAARVLGRAPGEVSVEHRPGRAPRLVLPPHGSGLHLSSSGRGGVAALAVGRDPLGIDIEAVEPVEDLPWRILHPAERAWLGALPARAVPPAFARLWAAKEAYLKALGTGFGREPSSFAALAGPDGEFTIEDRAGQGSTVRLETSLLAWRGRSFALALAELPGTPPAGVERLSPGT